MDTQDVELLETHKESICSDVIFATIAPALVQVGLLNRDELQQVQSKDSDARRMQLVLDILPSKGSDALIKFVSALQKDYRWLADTLLRSRPSTTNDCNSTCNANNRKLHENKLNQKISTEMITLVGKNYRVAQRWTSLAHSLELDSQIQPIRTQVFLYGEEHKLCINYLLKEWMQRSPNTAIIGNLLLVLRENSFNDIADELEQKFVI